MAPVVRVIVRRGIARAVLLVGPYAIKVPRLFGSPHDGLRGMVWSISRGLQANLSEIQWKDVEGVAPVLWSLGGIVNVYPRCEPVTEEIPLEEYEKIALAGVWFPRDKKEANVGWLHGKLVWLDYDGSWNGCPHSRNAAGLTTDED